MKSSFDFTNSNSFCAFETFSPTKRDLIYDGIQHASQCFKMLDILEMASLDEIIDAKDLISKEVICQENPQVQSEWFRPGPYPKPETCASLSSPCSLVVDKSIWATSSLGVVVRCVFPGFLLFFFFFFQLCCPLRFQNSTQTCQWEGFLLFGNFSSFTTTSPEWVSVHNSFVSLFVFYILFYLLLKRMGCLSGCVVSSTRVQKLFCESFSAFKWSFDKLVGGESGLPVLFLCHLGT